MLLHISFVTGVLIGYLQSREVHSSTA